MSRKFKSLLNLTTLATDPSGSVGDVFFNTTEKALKIHNGLIWVTIAKNDDPSPFYMHTHTYDGEVHTINLNETVYFDTLNQSYSFLTFHMIFQNLMHKFHLKMVYSFHH